MLRFARLFKNGRRNQNNGYSEKWKQKWRRRPRLIDFDHNIEITLAKEIFWIYCFWKKWFWIYYNRWYWGADLISYP